MDGSVPLETIYVAQETSKPMAAATRLRDACLVIAVTLSSALGVLAVV